jgi:hypothetical protein
MVIKAFKPKLLLIVVLLNTCINTYSQTIRYSRKTLKLPPYESMLLIPNVSGNHHLLFFKRNTAFTIYSFDRELQFLDKKDLPVRFTDTCDTRIIPFKNFYYLYLHKRGSSNYQLWKINSKGEATSLSVAFQSFIDSTFKKNVPALQFFNKDEQLVVIAKTYYDELKVAEISINEVDEHFKKVSSHNVYLPFEQESDRLEQIMLRGEHLFVLKSASNTQNYALELIKADLTTGKLFRKAFNCKGDFARNARLRYITADSSIFIQSTVRRQIFICKVDLTLKEVVPATLLAPQFTNNISNNFLLLSGGVQQWLTVGGSYSNILFQSNSNPYEPSQSPDMDRITRYRSVEGNFYSEYNTSMYRSTRSTSSGFGSYDTRIFKTYIRSGNSDQNIMSIRFVVFDKNFKELNDSVVTNKKGPTILTINRYANLMMGNKSHLILKQDLPRKRKGLLLVSVDDSNKIITSDITVFEKYEYLLQHAQTVGNGTLVMPYMQNSEVGLVKLSFANEGR